METYVDAVFAQNNEGFISQEELYVPLAPGDLDVIFSVVAAQWFPPFLPCLS